MVLSLFSKKQTDDIEKLPELKLIQRVFLYLAVTLSVLTFLPLS